jgi:hypothetical protein
MHVTWELAEFAVETAHEDLSLHVVEETERLLTCRMLICLLTGCPRLPAAQSPDE